MCLSANEADLEKNPNEKFKRVCNISKLMRNKPRPHLHYGVFTLKTTNVNFPSTLCWRIWKKRNNNNRSLNLVPRVLYYSTWTLGTRLPVILYLHLIKTRAGKSHDYSDVIIFEKLRFPKVFCPNQKTKPAFLNTVGLTVELILRFQIFKA